MSIASLIVAVFTNPVAAQPASTQTNDIVLGMSTALTGPAAKLGLNMRDGVNAAIEEFNRSGGLRGRKLALIALDDGYEPVRTVPNMHRLIGELNALAVIGNVGTPTAVAAIPIANAGKTLMFGAYTGAGVLRKSPSDRYVINYRASYAEETAAMVDGLVKEAGIRVEEIAFFTQRDAYGDAGYVGGIAAMKRHGLSDDKWIAHGRYERNTDAVESALAEIIGARTPAKAVIMVGAYGPCAEFIRLAREFEFVPLFLNVSFVGSEPLANVLGDAGDGVIITQVVPHFEADLPIATAYRRALKAFDSNAAPNFGSFEGYIAGRILILGLNRHSGEPTRESIVDSLEALGSFEIGLRHELNLAPDNHQACHRVWPTVIRKSKVVPFDWHELRR